MQDDVGNVLHTVAPDSIQRIHLLGVAGTGMGSFAGMLKVQGYEVTGSDENVYPPMSDMLKTWGIPVMTPYRPENIDAAAPDLVIVGNVIRKINVEATEVRRCGIRQMSFPAALGALYLENRHSVVVAGTHGKTTTSALMGHVLTAAGRDPSFLVGGVTQNYSGNYRVGKGAHFVVEGDEYDTAYFDKGSKFLHYRPKTVILTSVEFDHADIFRDLAHYESTFAKLIELIPSDGHLVVSTAYPNAVALAQASKGKVTTYRGMEGAKADVTPRNLRFGSEGIRFKLVERGTMLGDILLPMAGVHNLENALGVIAAARGLGLSFEDIRQGLASFLGVKRRQEVRAEVGGVLVIDDFAHHPTAVKETILAIRSRYPHRRVWAVFEPRSNTSRRNIHQEEYASSFKGAQKVTIKIPEKTDRVPEGEELNVPLLAQKLSAQGIDATAENDVAHMVQQVASHCEKNDVILVMSNGGFGGFIDKLIASLNARSGVVK